jgi:RHS repeat-associated protein
VFALGANNAKLAVSAPGITVNLRFAGQYADSESNLFYNGYRSYAPAIGSYSQMDPIGLSGGFNRRGYAQGNALSFSDPDGHLAIPVVMGIVGGVAGGLGNYLVQTQYQGKCDVEWRDVANATFWGAAAGASLPYFGTTILGAGMIGALANSAQYGTALAWNGEQASFGAAAWSATLGFGSGILGGTFTRAPWYGASATALPELARSNQAAKAFAANAGFANGFRNGAAGVTGSLPKEQASGSGQCGCRK